MKLDSAVFYSNDIPAVTDFYVKILGFKVEYQQVEKFVSFIFENGGRLGIKKAVEEREKPGAQTVFIGVEDIESVYNELKAKGVVIRKDLNTLAGFGKNFSILDPDQNKVQFVERNQS